jgi:4a-hydroxytetrahydrobiopterin dehydratase
LPLYFNRQPTTDNRQPTTDNRQPTTDNRQPTTDNRQPTTDNRQPTTDNSFLMWTEKNNKLYRKFEFKDFSEAFSFMTRVALIAEKMDHHPTWTNTYNSLEIWLSTHDAGDTVTDKDQKLARKIDQLL